MDTPIPGIPTEYQAVVPVAIGVLASYLVAPLTALYKKLGKSEGITTVTISAALSALIAGVAGYATGLYGTGSHAVFAAIGASLTAFLKANGDYQSRVNANKKAITEAAPTDGLSEIK